MVRRWKALNFSVTLDRIELSVVREKFNIPFHRQKQVKHPIAFSITFTCTSAGFKYIYQVYA